MKVLLLLAALANPVAPPQPASTPPLATQDNGKEALRPHPNLIDDRRIQLRPGTKKPGPDGKPGPGIG